jgi:CubicO group peptidase (beta-lactamase class C family)
MLLLLLAGFGALCASQPEPRFTDPQRRSKLEKAFPEVDRLFESYLQGRHVPGLVYGIVIDGELAHTKTFGVRERDKQSPVTVETVFRIASMTKSFTALAVLKLRDEGKLSLDDPVAKWIPEFARMQYATRDTAPIRVRQLLTHGAGFPEDNPWGDQQLGVSDETLTQWLKAGVPFSTAPDTEYEYSNYGFALLGRIVAKASKRPYREYLEQEILAPLGMKSSTLEPADVPGSVRATGYRRLPDGSYHEEKPLGHGSFGAMGGLLTSANDMGKYVAYMLAAWPARDDPDKGPVARASLREMQRVWRTSAFFSERGRAASIGYGYGLRVEQDCRFAHIVGHGGGLPGFGSYMMWLPEHGVGMFAMANLTYSGPGSVMAQAFDVLKKSGGLERRKLPPAPVLTTTRDAIVSLVREWSDEKADALAADNLFKDIPRDVLKKRLGAVREGAGKCVETGEVEPENWLRGRFRMSCEKAWVNVTFTLAPTMPPKVQSLQTSLVMHPDANTKSAIDTVVAALGAKGEAFAAPAVQAQVDSARESYGTCRAGEFRSSSSVRLDCERSATMLTVSVDAEGRLASVSFSRPGDVSCAP